MALLLAATIPERTFGRKGRGMDNDLFTVFAHHL